MAREVFISYRKEDKASADRICGALESDNIKCWIAPRDIAVGREWAASIVEALKACSSFVVVLSSNSKNAKQISREAELADNVGLPIITVRIEDVEPPPELQYFLGNIQWLDAFGANFDSAMSRLADVVRGSGGSRATLADTPAVEKMKTDAPGRSGTGSASPASLLSNSPAVPLPPVSALPRRGLSPYIVIGALVLIVVLAVAIWWALRPSPAPNQNTDAASAFGVEYLRQRDSGQPSLAYSMTGPAFRKHWTSQKFAADSETLKSRGKVTQYAPVVPCTERERGAYACEYLVSFSDGKKKRESLTISKRKEGWAIAADPALASQ